MFGLPTSSRNNAVQPRPGTPKRELGAVAAVCMLLSMAAADARTHAATTSAPLVTAAETLASALPPAGHAHVIFGTDTVTAEVATTPDERAQGLMYREEVPDGTGMLFVFQDSGIRSFWMANTYVALDIAYMDTAYRIINIVAMEPLDTDTRYASTAPAMFALEVRQGWFEEHGIEAGAQAKIVFGVRPRG